MKLANESSKVTPLGVAVLLTIVVLVVGGTLLRDHFQAVEAEDTLTRIKRTGFARIGYANEAPYGSSTQPPVRLPAKHPKSRGRSFGEWASNAWNRS